VLGHGSRLLENVLPARDGGRGGGAHQRPHRRAGQRRRLGGAQSAQLGPRAAGAHRGRGVAAYQRWRLIRYTGARVKRIEDPRLLRGQGRFIDDIALPRMLHAAFVRSPHAHAAVRRIDGTHAREIDGVAAVLGADDLEAAALAPRVSGGGFTPTAWPALAREPRFCGEAVAVVAATSAYVAADAVERVRVDYDTQPACVTLEQAVRDDAVLFRRAHRRGDVEAVFASAPVVVRETCTHGRLTAAPLEPRGLVADWDGGTLTVWASTQTPHIMRGALAATLG